MGFISGTASFVRYQVEGEIPSDFWEFAAKRIALYSFKDIDDSYEEKSAGWVSVVNMFDTEFAYASYAAGDYIALSMRVDERKISPAILKKFCFKEEERIKKQRQLPRLNRSQKLEIKENIKLMLTKKAMPAPAVYDLAWNLGESTLLFFSTNRVAQAQFEELFKETFGLAVVLQVPYLTAAHLLGPEEEKVLAELGPEIFI